MAAAANSALKAAANSALTGDELAKSATAITQLRAALDAGSASHATTARVSYQHLGAEWRSAVDRSRKQLDQFAAAFLADPRNRGHVRFAEAKAAVSGIAQEIPVFAGDFDGALAAIDKATDEPTRTTARRTARAVVAGYDSQLDGADVLRQLQKLSDDEYGGIAFFSELRKALGSLGAQLETTK